MSLINDALKRAKEAQPINPPSAPGPQFRPAEPAPTTGRGMGMTVLFVGVLIAFIGVIFLVKIKHAPARIQVAAETRPATQVNIVSETKPVVPPVATPTPIRTMSPSAPQKPVALQTAPVPVVSVPAPIRLQAIFYSPGHSSAIISGRTVRAGDVFKGFRVAAIGKNSATLVSATQTNVMTLEEQ